MTDDRKSAAVVAVGIDGSRAALDAALWAVDEAVHRDIPLRLVYAIPPRSAGAADACDQAARDLAEAEVAVRYAFTAVESTNTPVKVEVEILQDTAVAALREVSRSAVLLCVGAVGFNDAAAHQVGSTAAAIAISAHCPVAVVRSPHGGSSAQGCVVADVSQPSTRGAVLEGAIAEAQLRGLPLRAVTTWQSHFGDGYDSHAVADRNRLARAELDRRLAPWRARYPDVDLTPVVAHGTTLNYLAQQSRSIQIVVVGRGRGATDIVGPAGYPVLQNTGCSVLVCGSDGPL